MTGSAKRKGDFAEREAARLLYDLLGVECERKLGAGRKEDTGDIYGIPRHPLQRKVLDSNGNTVGHWEVTG